MELHGNSINEYLGVYLYVLHFSSRKLYELLISNDVNLCQFSLNIIRNNGVFQASLFKGEVSPIFGITMNSQKRVFSMEALE